MAIREYHNGALDTSNSNSKYQQKQILKKQKIEREKRKKQNRIDFVEF